MEQHEEAETEHEVYGGEIPGELEEGEDDEFENPEKSNSEVSSFYFFSIFISATCILLLGEVHLYAEFVWFHQF